MVSHDINDSDSDDQDHSDYEDFEDRNSINIIIIMIMMMNTTRLITIHYNENNDNHLIKGSTSKDNIQHGAVGGLEILIIAKDLFLIILIFKVLEQYFQKTQYPDVYTREELAQRSVFERTIVLLYFCKKLFILYRKN